jgi:hypothetical protein
LETTGIEGSERVNLSKHESKSSWSTYESNADKHDKEFVLILHTFSNLSGIMVNSPFSTAWRAFSAKGSMVTNHCLLTNGSIIYKRGNKHHDIKTAS